MDIEIPQELADAERVPEDLDANVVGAYQFASPVRRRVAAGIYAGGALFALIGALVGWPSGMWVVAGGLAVLAVHHMLSSHDLKVSDGEALAIAARQVDTPVGHASAALRFEGWLATPVWNVLLYDAAEPPAQRALVQIDAKTGELARAVYIESLVAPSAPG